jgi:hypothetical protein
VTWRQLQANSAERHVMAMTPFLPNPLKSVVTNHLEREATIITRCGYADSVLTMEFVYPNQKIMWRGSVVVLGAMAYCGIEIM